MKNSPLSYIHCLLGGLSSWSQNLASLQVSVPIADKVGQKHGTPSSNTLWIMTGSYRAAGLEPDGCKSFFFFQKFHLDLPNF